MGAGNWEYIGNLNGDKLKLKRNKNCKIKKNKFN
jgi:hypothetical protein